MIAECIAAMSPSVRLTRLGAVVVSILVVCGVLVAFATEPVRVVAAAVGCVVLLLVAGEGLGGQLGSGGARKREVLRRQARPRHTEADPAAVQGEPSDSGLLPRRRRR